MSTVRRLFDHPKNAEVQGNRVVQTCCDGRAPYWDTYRIRDTEDAFDDSTRNMTAYKQSDSILVQDDTGASDNDREVVTYDANGRATGTNGKMQGYVRVEGPNSGYRPDFITPTEWMKWQGVEFSSDPRGVRLAGGGYSTQLPNPPRWRRTQVRTDKVRWGKGVGNWGGSSILLPWCPKCETALEKAWSDTLDVLPIAARGIAMIVSYIPVFGTAISFVVNAAVTLAQGGTIDQAVLDGIGGSLPGQPTSGIVFNAAVAIAKGERIDKVAIAALPVDKTVKDILYAADDLIYGIATGENFEEEAYQAVYNRLPPQAQQAMGYARRIINGENVPQMLLTEAERAVVERVRAEAQSLIDAAKARGQAYLDEAKAQADSLYRQYAMETGYQVSLLDIPIELRDAVSTGIAVGVYSQQHAFVGTFGSVPESNVAVNETYFQKGQRIIADGARYRGRLLSDILKTGLTIDIDQPNLLTGQWSKVRTTYKPGSGPWAQGEVGIDDAWRRGFTIAIGVCQGMSERGPGQLAVYQTLAEKGGRAGFDAGQAVQYDRTLKGDWGQLSDVAHLQSATATAMVEPLAKTSAVQSVLSTLAVKPPPSTATQQRGLPTNLTPVSATVAMPAAVLAQKALDRAAWVDYYTKLI